MKNKNPRKILYVCTGNTCRSPMAEYLTKEMACERGLSLVVSSRGINVFKPSAANEMAQIAVKEIYPNAKIENHLSTKLKPRDILDYDLVLTMTFRHRNKLLNQKTLHYGKVHTLKGMSGVALESIDNFDVEDPYGAGEWSKDFLEKRDLMKFLSSEAYEKTYEFGNQEKIFIIDPIYKLNIYRNCRDEILHCLSSFLDKLE